MCDDSTTFKLTLDEEYYSTKDSLVSYGGIKVEIIGKVGYGNSKWYHRLINFLTFQMYFNRHYTYNCRIIK